MHRNRRSLQLLLGLFVALFILVDGLKAQNVEGFMYGKVYTHSNTYEGQIRWGKEEAFWNDHFNASKTESLYESYARKQRDREESRDLNWSISSIWEDRSNNVVHQFVCQFGDIAEIRNHGRSSVTVKLRNGEEMRLSGEGYNDIGSDIVVLDAELGKVTVRWDKIDRVEFVPTPRLERVLGHALYGSVETYRKGTLTGFVQWDHDERIGTDKLDGDTREGDLSIRFDNISRIEKDRNGSLVKLKSGRDFFLTGSNDVNGENRGVIVSIEGVGKVDIPWREFRSVNFEKINHSGPAYGTYSSPKELSGTVFQYNDEQEKGTIIFDLDEAWGFEILDAKDDEIEYKIPFRNIKRIKPKNADYSLVELRNKQELLLGDSRDVSDRNGGLLVFKKGEKEPVWIEWRKITEIVFD